MPFRLITGLLAPSVRRNPMLRRLFLVLHLFGVFLAALTPLLMRCRAYSVTQVFFAGRGHTSAFLSKPPLCKGRCQNQRF